jgi:hypothetical protein
MEDIRIVGKAEFTDGTIRDAFEHAISWQFVMDDDNEPVLGQWLMPPDDPWIREPE